LIQSTRSGAEWSYQHRVRDGSFELHGLDPEKPVLVCFLDAEHEWGAAIKLSGNQAGEEVTIHLERCGQAKARFVSRDGKPVADADLEFVATPHLRSFQRTENEPPGLIDDSILVAAIDRKHYGHPVRPVSEGDGRFTLPNLILGALYRLSAHGADERTIRKDIRVKPGESVELGEISIALLPGAPRTVPTACSRRSLSET
jgi:hypothetical protein